MPPLQPFGDDIWIVEGAHVRVAGVLLPTRMIVVRLGNGSVWINSPVDVSRGILNEIQAIGSVQYLVAPTPLHVWRLERWRMLLPSAQLWGPPKPPRSDISFSGLLQDTSPAAWIEDIEQVAFKGNLFIEEIEFFHKKSRTLMMTDLIQNYAPRSGDFFGNTAKALGGVLNGGVPRDARWSLTKRSLARAALKKMLSWDFDKMIVAHGANVESDAKAFVEAAFRWLESGS